MENKEVLKRVRDHYDYALKYFNDDENRIFGVFLVGSQNYGLAEETSDVDTKIVVVPSIDDWAQNKQPISTTLKVPVGENNYEQATIVDFRLWIDQLRKGNINSLETLFTPYHEINAFYAYEMHLLWQWKEEIAHMNAEKVLNATFGMLHNNAKYILRETEDTQRLFEKYGYNPKKLMGLFRVLSTVEKYIEGKDFAECLDCSRQRSGLLAIKHGKYNRAQAEVIAETLRQEAYDLETWFNGNKGAYLYEDKEKEMVDKLNKWRRDLLITAYRMEVWDSEI